MMLTGVRSSWHLRVGADVHCTPAGFPGHIPTAHLPIVVSDGPSPSDGAGCVSGEEVPSKVSLYRYLLILEVDFKAFSFWSQHG